MKKYEAIYSGGSINSMGKPAKSHDFRSLNSTIQLLGQPPWSWRKQDDQIMGWLEKNTVTDVRIFALQNVWWKKLELDFTLW